MEQAAPASCPRAAARAPACPAFVRGALRESPPDHRHPAPLTHLVPRTCSPDGTYQPAFGAKGNDSCAPCGPAQFAAPGSAACTECPPGAVPDLHATFDPFFNTTIGAADACAPCEAGTYRGAGMPACERCSPGTFASPGNASCTPCPAGTYANGYASPMVRGWVCWGRPRLAPRRGGRAAALGAHGCLAASVPQACGPTIFSLVSLLALECSCAARAPSATHPLPPPPVPPVPGRGLRRRGGRPHLHRLPAWHDDARSRHGGSGSVRCL